MKNDISKKNIPEIDPIPLTPHAVPPPEIAPQPDKNRPSHPSPEIIPLPPNPEIKPNKENL